MLKKLIVVFCTVAVMAASAATYKVTLFQNATVDGKSLKAGDYKVEVRDNNVVLKHDKDVTEVAARTETADKKFPQTLVRFNAKSEVTEICIGGTTTKIVFAGDKNPNGI